MARIHIVLDETDKARYRRQAEREGMSLGAWLREAAEARLRDQCAELKFESPEELRAFFQECDRREASPEPSWESHLRVIAGSRSRGSEPT
jgi:hypothetical protein